jgi:hypothetical protein
MQTSVPKKNGQALPNETVAPVFCTYHPNRETVLRCNRCDKPICYECAVRTPVGYRCKDCVRQQQSIYFNAEPQDPVIAAVVGLALGIGAGLVAGIVTGIFAGLIGLLVAFFAGPAAGGIIAEAVRWSVRRRRARRLNVVVIVAAAAGMLLGGMFLGGPIRSVFTLISTLLFAVLALSTIYARLQ